MLLWEEGVPHPDRVVVNFVKPNKGKGKKLGVLKGVLHSFLEWYASVSLGSGAAPSCSPQGLNPLLAPGLTASLRQPPSSPSPPFRLPFSTTQALPVPTPHCPLHSHSPTPPHPYHQEALCGRVPGDWPAPDQLHARN